MGAFIQPRSSATTRHARGSHRSGRPSRRTRHPRQPANVTYSGTPVVVTPAATASSGLAVTYTLVSGPATYDSVAKTFTVTGTGSITIRASQAGSTTYATAAFVDRTFLALAPGADTLDSFLNAAGVPADKRGPLDDPDGDGLSNLLEYALGLAPNSTSPSSLPATVLSSGNLTLTYRRAAGDVTYIVEANISLANPAGWTSVGVIQGTPDGNGNTTATLPATGAYQFLRLRVSR